MNFQDLVYKARQLLGARGGLEIPAYAGPLPQFWMHPDVLFRMPGDEHCKLFIFQSRPETLSIPAEKSPALPWLVFFQKPFQKDWMTCIPNLISCLSEPETNPEKPLSPGEGQTPGASYLEVTGLTDRPGLLSETGPAWRLAWKGYEVGRMLIFTGLLDQPLSVPCGVSLFNLEAILKVAELNFGGKPTFYAQGLDCRALFALKSRPFSPGFFEAEREPKPEELRDKAESVLAEKGWFEAYQTILEGHALCLQPCSPNYRGKLEAFESALKSVLQKITFFQAARTQPTAKSGREGAIK